MTFLVPLGYWFAETGFSVKTRFYVRHRIGQGEILCQSKGHNRLKINLNWQQISHKAQTRLAQSANPAHTRCTCNHPHALNLFQHIDLSTSGQIGNVNTCWNMNGAVFLGMHIA